VKPKVERSIAWRLLTAAGLVVLVLAAVGAQLSAEAQQRKEEKGGKKVRIREEKGPAGHKTIGIDERLLGRGTGQGVGPHLFHPDDLGVRCQEEYPPARGRQEA